MLIWSGPTALEQRGPPPDKNSLKQGAKLISNPRLLFRLEGAKNDEVEFQELYSEELHVGRIWASPAQFMSSSGVAVVVGAVVVVDILVDATESLLPLR